MNKEIKNLKVAIVSDHCFSFAGASSTTRCISEIFSNVDFYFLMGDRKKTEEYFNTKNIYFSFLNRLLFISKYYRYTYFLWPIAIESFDFSKYDLVISSSFSVSHGVITGTDTKHISYIHTPMRYAWDLSKEYFGKSFFLKRWIVQFFLNLLRIWDVSASGRSDILISNSNFVSKRIRKYWGRYPDYVIYPPVSLYKGKMVEKREGYFVTGAPFEVNKGGEFILRCAADMCFELKVIGVGDSYGRLKRIYSRYRNIQFLGRVSEEKKWEILSNATGFISAGVEDFGIFPVEAMSAGTPVLAYMGGGYLDTVQEDLNGMFFREHTIEGFENVFKKFSIFKWDREKISESSKRFSKERFINEMGQIILKNL